MPQALDSRAEEKVRQFLVDAIRPAQVQGYDPQETDPTASDFLPITNDWSDFGDTYPLIVVQETDGPTVPNSGTTNANGLKPTGGLNQMAVYNVTVSCQAVQMNGQGAYRNNTDFDDLVEELYAECFYQFQNTRQAVNGSLWTGLLPPPTQTRNQEETDSGSTITFVQRQGSVPVGVINESA